MKRAQVVPITATHPIEDRAAIVDEYGRLDARLREIEPLKKRREVLREKILSWHTGASPDAQCISDGRQFSLLITACDRKRAFSMIRVKARIGLKRLLEICSVTFEALKAEIGEREAEEFSSWERSGPRHIVVTAMAREAEAA